MVTERQPPLYVRFQADIWVEVDPADGIVAAVVLDQKSMERAVEVIDGAGDPVEGSDRAKVEEWATGEWPSWDYR